MGTERLRFVDGIDTANERLDLNDLFDANDWGGFHLVERPEFPPPPLRRTFADSWTDGSELVDASYENRELRFRLLVKGALDGEDKPSVDDMADRLTLLARELDRDRNVLEWRPDGASSPVFFRTYRSPMGEPRKTSHELPGAREIELVIAAEPFAYGPRETLPTMTVSSDPAGTTRPRSVQLTGIKGDVATPLFIVGDMPAFDQGHGRIFATRRHGDSDSLSWFEQAENMILGSGTTLQAHDGAMSGGAAQNYCRTVFTNANDLQRLTTRGFLGGGVATQGTYRIFASVRKSAAGSSGDILLALGLQYSGAGGKLPQVPLPATSTRILVDLGLVSIGVGSIDLGLSGRSLPFIDDRKLGVWAQRVTGSASLDWDYVLALPADDEFAAVLIDPQTDGGTYFFVYDSRENAAYQTYLDPFAAGAMLGRLDAPSQIVGRLPWASPGDDTRLFLIPRVSASTPGLVNDVVTDTDQITAHYWPRYLYLRS